MAFKAGEAVEPLGYDFTAFDGPVGDTPEPAPEQIAQFWQDYGTYMREQRNIVQEFRDRLGAISANEDLKDLEKETQSNAIEREYEQAQKSISEERRKRRCEMFAALCSDSPSYDALYALPGRILDAFENYLLEEMSPKVSKPGTSD